MITGTDLRSGKAFGAETPPTETPATPGATRMPTGADLRGRPAEARATPFLPDTPPVQEEATFWDGAKYGASEATNPFNVNPGEQKRALSSGASTAGYLLSNVATSLGVNAALTAATGAAAAPLAGARTVATAKNIATGLYALYQGLGRDRVRTVEEGRSWKPLDGGKGTATALLTSALELNPLMKAGSKLNAVLRVGAQAAGEAANEKLHGGDNKDMLFAAAAGVVGAGLPLYLSSRAGPVSGAVEKAVAEETLEGALSTKTPEIFTKTQEKLGKLGLDRPAEATTEFMRAVVGDKTASLDAEALEKAFAIRSKGMGPKKLDEQYTLMQTDKAYNEAAGEAVEKNFKEMGVPFKEPSLGERLLMPMFYVARQVDNATGMDTARLVDKFTQAHNRHNTIAKHFTDRLLPLQKEAKQMGLSGQDVSNLITMEDEGAYKALVSKLGEPKANDYRSRLQDVISGDKGLLGYLKELGYNPAQRKNYMPMKAQSSTKIASILQGKMEALPAALGGRDIRDVRLSLEKAAAQQGGLDSLLASDPAAATISLLDKTAERLSLQPIQKLQDFSAIREQLLSGGRWAENAQGIPDSLEEISALFARKGEVPGEIRENDAWKLLAGYVNENLRAAHFEDALQYGRLYTDVLNKLGMKKTSELFENYVKDQAGGARFLNGAIRKLNSKIEFTGSEKVRKAVGKWDERLGKAIEGLPEFTSWLNSQVYPAKLALNVPGIIRNSTQFMATTIPELGATGIYGTKKAAAAARAILGEDANKIEAVKKIVREMEDKGLLSNHGRLETSEFSKAFGGAKGTVDSLQEKMFMAYQATDKFNRILTWKMGREVAADILSENPDAIKFLGSLDSATKQHLRSIIGKPMGGKEKLDAVHDIVGRYLISKTQFDYSTANKAEWARLAGPMFSMFTTWPAMVGGDMVDVLKNKGALQGGKKLLSKYLPFYGLAMAANAAVNNSDSDTAKYLFGNTTSYSPLDSVLPSGNKMAGRGGLLSNPLIDNATKAAKSALTGDVKALGRQALTEGATTYAPIVAPILNEIDRYTRVRDGKKFTAKQADKLGLKEDK